MPMDRARYPSNWEAIALSVKQAANWQCENCGKLCQRSGEDWLDFVIRIGWTVGEAIAASQHPTRWVLTTAHLNHDPENPHAELRAWCAPCHCRYDLAQLPRKRRLKQERLGQISLFASEPAGHGKEPTRLQVNVFGGDANG